MRHSWRREAVALVLVAVLGAACVLFTLRIDGRPYQESQPGEVTRAAAGETASLGGMSYAVTRTRRVAGGSAAGERLEVAPDATLVIVSLEVDPDPEARSCTLRLVDPTPSEETRWDTAGFDDTTYSPPDRFESYCADDATEPYELQVPYVVPREVADRVELEVSDLQLLPRALRLDLAD